MDSSTPNNEKLELGEVEKSGDLYEKAMGLGYEKMDLQKELAGLYDSGFTEGNEQIDKVEVEISLIDRQLNSVATQWAEGKVCDVVKDPERRAKRVSIRKEHFLARVERKMRRNERRIDRFEKQGEGKDRSLDRRTERWQRREGRRDARQEARRERRAGRNVSERRRGRWEAREIRRDGRQARRMERRMDRLERKGDRKEDGRDERTVIYDKGQIGDPGMPWSREFPSYGYRGDQVVEGADRETEAYGDNGMARQLIEAGIDPSDLTAGGARSIRAVEVVYADEPETVQYYKEGLSQDPQSPEYQEVMEELQAREGELADPYRILQRGEVARRQLEKSSLQDNMWGKFTSMAGDFGRNPGALLALTGVAVGLYLLRDKIFTKDVGRVVGGLALAAAGVYTVDFVMEKMDKEHRGLFDRMGFKPSDLLSPDVLDRYRTEYFPGLPQKDRDSTDEMIRLFNVPMSRMNDVYEQSLNKQETSIDTGLFLGENGVDSKVESHMDGTDLHRGLTWFYLSCAERAAGRRGLEGKDQEARLRMGLEYAKTHYAGLSFKEASYKLNIEPSLRRGGSDRLTNEQGKAAKREPTFERNLSFPTSSMGALVEKSPSVRQVMLGLPTGEVLVKGYPYEYNFSDQDKHVFRDPFDGSTYVIPDNLQGGDFNQRLSALVSETELKVEKKFQVFKGSTDAKLEYLESGEWRTVPPMPRLSHAGLNTGTDGIPTLLFADSTGFHITFEGAKKDQYFNSLEEMQKAYDLQKVFPELVNRDAGHLLAGLPYKVESVTDDTATASSTVKISYDGGFEGTLNYKNGVLESMNLTSSAELERRQEFEAQKITVELFSRPKIQDRLIDAKGIDPDFYPRWNNMITEGVVESEPNIEFNGGVFRTIGKTASEMFDSLINSNDITGDTWEARTKDETESAMDKELGDLIVGMNQELIDLYKKGYSRTKFEEEKKSIIRDYEGKIGTVLEKKVEIKLNPEDLDKAKDEAQSAIASALAPMKHWLSTDGNQEAMYDARVLELQQLAMAEIDTLFTSNPHPYKSEVDAIIQKHRTQASVEATEHRGLSASQSADVFNQDKLSGTHDKDWEPTAKLAYTYLSNNFKWEQFSFLSKRENFTDLMDLFYEKIDRGNPATDAEKSKQYVLNYFLPIVYIKLGGKDDFSLDRFYARLNAVSDTQYKAVKADLMMMKNYEEWTKDPEILIAPPELNDEYREAENMDLALKGFMDHFDKTLQIGTLNPSNLEFWDHKWPEYWRGSVERRARQIQALNAKDPHYTAKEYQEDLKKFRNFVAMEHNIYQILIQHRIEPKHKGAEIEQIIDQDFGKHWHNEDYVGYFNEFYYKIMAPDDDWLPEWNDSVIEEAHDGMGIEKLFNVPFV